MFFAVMFVHAIGGSPFLQFMCNTLLVLSIPAWVVMLLSSPDPKPRPIVTNGLLHMVWYLSWTVVTVIGAVSAAILAVKIGNAIQTASLRDIMFVLVIVLIWGVVELRELQRRVADVESRPSPSPDTKLPL
jgi:hypothetical protein